MLASGVFAIDASTESSMNFHKSRPWGRPSFVNAETTLQELSFSQRPLWCGALTIEHELVITGLAVRSVEFAAAV